jgi:hypothetical protein
MGWEIVFPSNDFYMTFVDYSADVFFWPRSLVYQKKMGYARTKTEKMDRKNAPAAGHPVLYYRIAINP